MKILLPACLLVVSLPFMAHSSENQKRLSEKEIAALVNHNINSLMEKEQIPGMAVGIIYNGQTQIFSYGLADVKMRKPVTANTLFELGSVSKTFTGLAAGIAIRQGIVNLGDPVSKYWASLPEHPWKSITMLNLATYTAGGLPLQVPDSVTDQESLQAYYKNWQPLHSPGTVRLYSNASIGLFGALAVKNSGLSFEQYLKENVLDPLNMKHTFIKVPQEAEKDYAWGYRKSLPVRVTPGMLDAEAYGVKSSAVDMVRYLAANMESDSKVGSTELGQAIQNAQTRYFMTDGMYQGLGWEMYDWPADPQKIISGSSNAVALKPQPTRLLTPPLSPSSASWVHKTGSTNGFGAYVAFIPAYKVGIVMLANKSYPNPARVETAYRIIESMIASD